MLNALRLWLARRFMATALNLFASPLTFEGLTAMTIFTRLEALEAANTALAARVATLEGATPGDTSGFATADSVTALADRVTAVEAEIGTETPAS